LKNVWSKWLKKLRNGWTKMRVIRSENIRKNPPLLYKQFCIFDICCKDEREKEVAKIWVTDAMAAVTKAAEATTVQLLF
jgi:hypothetical protein